MNAFDALIEAIVTTLRQAPAVSAGPIDEDIELESLAETIAEAVSVSHVRATPTDPGLVHGHSQEWTSDLVIECHARKDQRVGGGGARASRALAGAVFERLRSEPTLGGLVDDLGLPTVTTETAMHDTRIGLTTLRYAVMHTTSGPAFEL